MAVPAKDAVKAEDATKAKSAVKTEETTKAKDTGKAEDATKAKDATKAEDATKFDEMNSKVPFSEAIQTTVDVEDEVVPDSEYGSMTPSTDDPKTVFHPIEEPPPHFELRRPSL